MPKRYNCFYQNPFPWASSLPNEAEDNIKWAIHKHAYIPTPVRVNSVGKLTIASKELAHQLIICTTGDSPSITQWNKRNWQFSEFYRKCLSFFSPSIQQDIPFNHMMAGTAGSGVLVCSGVGECFCVLQVGVARQWSHKGTDGYLRC